jgi:hypothetical protein
MVHEITPSRVTLAPIEAWPTGDSRTLAFTVAVDDQGTPKDLSNDTIRWSLLRKPYAERSDAVVTDADAGVTLQTDGVVDPTAGEFRVDVAEDVVTGWGPRWQRVVVDPPDDSRQSWRGPVTLVARGGGDGGNA